MNEQNLDPVRTTEEAKRRGRNGGLKFAENQRKRKEFRDRLAVLLQMPLTSGRVSELEEIKTLADVQNVNTTAMDRISAGIVAMALKGDKQAIRLIMEVMGQLRPQAVIEASVDDGFLAALGETSDKDWGDA